MILAGPNTVDIFDQNVVKLRDLGSNFFLRPEHVGSSTLAEASLPMCLELNSYVNISIPEGDLSLEILT